jgi:hypothetical protein
MGFANDVILELIEAPSAPLGNVNDVANIHCDIQDVKVHLHEKSLIVQMSQCSSTA